MTTLNKDVERSKEIKKGKKRDFDNVDLRIFLNIDNASTLNEIAKLIGVSKQAVSTRINQLEDLFGIPLVQHGPLKLTEAGRRFQDYANADKDSRQKLLLDMASFRSNAGFLRIIAISSVLIDDANPALAETQSEFLHLTSTLIEGASIKIVRAVQEGTADIGLIGRDGKEDGLIFEKYRSTQAVLLLHENHPLSSRKEITIKELEPYRIIALPKMNLLDQKFVLAQVKHGAMIRPAHTAPDMEIAAQYACTTPMGATIVLEDVAKRYSQFYGANIVHFSEDWRHFDLFTITREIERRSDAMTYFINKLRKRYKK